MLITIEGQLMSKYSILLSIASVFHGSAFAITPKPIAEKDIDTFGVYVKSAEGYVALHSYEHMGSYPEYKYYNDIPVVNRGNDELELLIYQEDFDIQEIVFELRNVDMTRSSKRINFSVSPLVQENKYRLKTIKPVADGSLLQVFQCCWFQREFAVIALGDPVKEMLQALEKTKEPAYAVLPAIKELLQAFPKHPGFTTSLSLWEDKFKQEKDQRDYKHVQKSWDKFNQYKKISTKARFLRDVIREANNYLHDHPEGLHAAEAQERKTFAEAKLEEYKELL